MHGDGLRCALFKWVAILTGSKNALKGVGFFLGGLLLAWLGFATSLWSMAAALVLVLCTCVIALPTEIGKAKEKVLFSRVFSMKREINVLAAARFFLFGARDVWFVVGLPLFLYDQLEWNFTQVGGFLALWVIGYGFVQASAPTLLQRRGRPPGGGTAVLWTFVLAAVPTLIAVGLTGGGLSRRLVIIVGLALFAVIFAINSAVHSYLIVEYSDKDKISINVGFYYMANAGGRLVGTVLSGLLYQFGALPGCLWASVIFTLSAAVISLALPRAFQPLMPAGVQRS